MNKKILIAGLIISVMLLVPINSAYSNIDIQIENKPIISSNRSNTLYVGGNGSGNYSRIQDAIDNASDGDTVFVYDDSSPYYEDIIVDKSLNIKGENRDSTIIHNLDSSYVISITTDWVNISSFSIQCFDLYYYSNGIIIYSDYNNIFDNNISENYYGIYLENSSNYNIIKNNIIYDNTIGIFLSNADNNTITNNDITLNNYLGISIYSSKNNTIKDNSFYKNQHDIEFKNSYNNNLKDNYFEDTRCCECICLSSSDNNLITGNLIFPISATGIRLWSSSYNIIIKNTISKGGGISILKSSDYNTFSNNSLYYCGFSLSESYINYFYNNTVNGKPLVYLVGKSDTAINIEAGQIIILNCDNITVKNQELCNTSVGIILWYSENCSIFNNNFKNNRKGISLPGSINNIIIDNYFTKNGFGISLGGSSSNIIMDNKFYSGHHSDIEILNNSTNNIIKSNILYNNYWNGIRMWRAYNNSIIFNIVSSSYLSVIFDESSNNNITGNNITNNEEGIRFSDSSQKNFVTDNNISNNDDGITFFNDDNDNNYIYHNNFLNNGRNAYIHSNSISSRRWDNGYPSGGNYWDDYDGVDNFSGPNQDIPGSDGIGDTPYDIPSFVKNEDRFPLMEPLGENYPPSTPVIEGKRKFKEGKDGIYTFTIYSIDVNGDSISYLINWSDGVQEWTDFYASGEKLKINVSIPVEKGTYFIFKIKAKDIFGAESDWAELVITVPRDKSISSSPLLRFLERYPMLQALFTRLCLQ